MATISTVLGPIDSTNLGFTLMHEHLIVAPTGIFTNYPELLGTNLMERVVDILKKAKEGGVDTIVDATTLDLDRNVALLAEASRRSGVNIIACTGWHLNISPFFYEISADKLADVFVREIEQGIAGTDMKAGILKAASDMAGVRPEEETVLRAVARARRAHHPLLAPAGHRRPGLSAHERVPPRPRLLRDVQHSPRPADGTVRPAARGLEGLRPAEA